MPNLVALLKMNEQVIKWKIETEMEKERERERGRDPFVESFSVPTFQPPSTDLTQHRPLKKLQHGFEDCPGRNGKYKLT